ncbi:TonB-dependent receptor [Chitinophaga qingshengii]|uniref:TonB-dependent receptor n=1 Tax=Chitinophaga qingshengii TaxID=1569794 RepID=A0ABR7TMH3_9BACT|nr:TonB-dependent receptor [Chitinophaga qingshengii]MBC9930264.1 TonB-dependent receptor [Chitinophaga qingshengii]
MKFSTLYVPPKGQWKKHCKILMIMKLTVFLLFVACLQVSAAGYAQQLTLSEQNVPLERVFKKIEQQSRYLFWFENTSLHPTRPVSIQVKAATLQQVLDECFRDQPLTYSIVDNVIVVTAKPAAPFNPLNLLQVKGRVTDEKGIGLPGAIVRIKGSTDVTSTNANGEFTFKNAGNNAVLVVSYVGYVTQEIPYSGQDGFTVVLKEKPTGLDEVIVVGYGQVAKKDLTGSVATIKGETFENVPILTLDQMLQGKAPGMQVTSISGQPGDGTSIRIRGGNSLSASNEPLYVVDGIIAAGDEFNLNLLNPEDIASIDVLKDASSTAIYGARGSNGVILITTKKGKTGRDRVSVNVNSGYQELPKFIDMMSGPEYAQMVNDQLASQGKPAFYPDVNNVPNTNWQKEITRAARQNSVTAQASGGDAKSTYMISGNYADQEGIILNSGFKRYQFRLNYTRNISSKVQVNTTLNAGSGLTQNNPVSLGGLDYYSSALGVAPSMPVYKDDGTFALKREYSSGNLNHPLAQATFSSNPIRRNNLLGNVTINYKPIKGLTFKTSFGTELNFTKNNSYSSGQMPVAKANNNGGVASVATTQDMMYLLENTVSYNQTIRKNHRIDAVAGMTFQTANTEYVKASGSKYPTDGMEYNNLNGTDQSTFYIGSSYSQFAIVSYLGRVNYGFKDRYLLTLTGRVDGSSRFAANNKYAFFPAVALAWRAIEEPFIKNLNVFSNLKLRASYGKVGSQAIAPYGSLPTLTGSRYILGSNSNTLGYVQGNYGNADLRWETTGQYDLGIEAGFFNNRLTIEADVYTKRTNDLLNNKQLPEQTGYSSIRTNIGAIRNSGIELMVNTVNIDRKNFKWSTSFNIAHNKNKVVDLGGVDYILTQNVSYAGNVSRLTLNDPVGTFWGADYYGTRKTLDKIPGAVSPNAVPRLGEALYVDRNGDGKLSVDDYHVIGDANPRIFGGMANNLTYKQFTLNFYISYSEGNQIMNIADAFYNSGDLLSNQYKTLVNRWSPQNPNSDIPAFSRDYIPNTRWIYDGSFIRLKSLTLGYNIPAKTLRARWFQNINVYLSASNLFLITSYPYYDPETNAYGRSSTVRGFDATNYPQSRTYVAGIKIDL